MPARASASSSCDGGVPVIGGRARGQPRRASATCCRSSGETLPDAAVDTSPRLSSSAARDAAIGGDREGRAASPARGSTPASPSSRSTTRGCSAAPARTSPRSCGRLEVKGSGGLDGRPARVRRRPDRQRGAPHRPDREHQEPHASATRATRAAPAARTRAPRRSGTERLGPARGRGRRRRARLRVRRRHLRLLLHALRARQPRRQGPAAEVDRRLLRPARRVPAPRTRSGTAPDGLRRRLRRGATTWSATSSPTASPTFSSHLFYYYQSGAINESLSDVFGEFVDQTNSAGAATTRRRAKWQIGEDLPIGAIRDMKNPPAFGDPDRMTSAELHARPGEADAGGVHTNSGVNNKAAYLITDRATAFNGRTITGIGIDQGRAHLLRGRDGAASPRAATTPTSARALPQACDNLVGTVGHHRGRLHAGRASAVAATEMSHRPAGRARARGAGRRPAAPTRCSRTCFFDDMENPTPATTNWFTRRHRRLELRRHRTPTAATSTCAARTATSAGTARSR